MDRFNTEQLISAIFGKSQKDEFEGIKKRKRH